MRPIFNRAYFFCISEANDDILASCNIELKKRLANGILSLKIFLITPIN